MRGTDAAALAATALSTAVWTATKAGYLDAAISSVSAPTAAQVADAVLDELVSEHVTLGSLSDYVSDIKSKTDTLGGAGAVSWIYTVTVAGTGTPIPDVTVWVTSDEAGVYVVATDTTNVSGVAHFSLAAGTYYVWCAKVGYTFTNPDTETVS
jgi:hypothetical protein